MSTTDGVQILPLDGPSQPPQSDPDPYRAAVQRVLERRQTGLRRSQTVVDGLDGTPDDYAKAARFVDETGMPLHRGLGVVQAAQAQPEARTAAMQRLAAKSPTLARWLSDPARMGAATDDAEALERLDASLRKLRNTTTNRDLAESISSAVLAGPRGVSSEIAGGFYDKMAGYMGALAAGVGDYALMQVHNAVRTAKEGQTDPSLRPGYIVANLGPDQYGPEADRSRSILRRAFREAAAGQVTHYSRLAAEQRAQRTAAANRYFQGIEDAEGRAVVRHMLSSPRGLSLLVAQNLSFALDPLVGGAAGFAAGGVPGAAVGAFGGSVAAEYGPWINGRLSGMGYDLTDPDQVQAAYTNRPLMAQLRDEALKKGVATAGIDAAFQVITGGVSRALRGPGYALAAVRGTAALGSETLGEFASELGGKYSATGEVDLKEALIEAVASLGQSAGQAGLGGAFSGVSRGTAPARERVARAAQAHIDARTLHDAIAGWRASHVARRLPEALRELVTQHVALGDDSESAAQAFIDLETWDDHASAAEADPIELLDAFVPGEGADRYEQAEKTGQIVIPLERYIEGVAGDTAHDPLVELTRFREAGVTLAEADEALTVEDLPGLGEALTGEVAQAGESTRLFQESRNLERRRAEVEKEIAALEGGEAAAADGPAEATSGDPAQDSASDGPVDAAAVAPPSGDDVATDPAAASQRLAALQAERAEIDTRLERIQQTEELAANLEDRLTADLVAAGEKSERAARIQTMPLVHGYRTLAERAGLALADMLDWFQTRVGAPGSPGSVRMGRTADPSFTDIRIDEATGQVSLDVSLLRTADRSTFLHETGHVLFEILKVLAEAPGAAPGIVEMHTTLTEWLGYSPEEWAALSLEERREGHETFARGFEQNMKDGKAPSAGMRRVFATFKKWLARLYPGFNDLQVELTPEVREVMGRFLATDEEIAAVQYEIGPAKLPEVYLEGLSDEERARIAAKEAAAQDAAVEGLETDRRRLEAEAERDERSEAMETYRAQAAAEIDAAPATQALYLLRDGTAPDGSPLPEGVEPAKIARGSVPTGLRNDLNRLGVLTDEGEVFDSVLAAYGATSGEDFVAKLRNAKNRDRIVEQVARAMMAKDRGRAPSQREVRSAARRRSANQERSELLEIKAREAARRARAAERRADAADESEADRRAAYDAIPTLPQLRAQAKAALATVPEIDLQPHLYASTAARMGRLSDDRARAGDWSMAAQYAERERYNHELHRVANQMRRRAEQNRKALLKFTDGKKQEILGKAGWSYQDQINALLARFNLRPMGRKKIEALKSLAEWLTSNTAQREAAGDTRPIEVSEKLKDEAFRKPWRELTLGEMEQVRESVEAIYHLAATKHRMFTAQKDRQFAEVRDDVLAQLEASKAEMPRPAGAKSRREQFFDSQVANYLAAHKKVPLWARLVDENEDGGPLVRAIVRPANEAATVKAMRKAADGKRLDAVFGILHDWGTSEFRTRHDVPGFSRGQLTHEDRLAAALHWGNETGRERLIGHATKRGWVSSPLGWSEADMQAVLATLTEEDVRFLNELYAYYDSFKPEIEARDRRTKGIAPEWVEPIAYETPGGKVTGGYHKLKYGDRAQEFEISEQAKLALQGVAASSNTRQGHLKTRVATVGEGTVRLDFGVTFEHIEETLHDLTHHEALLDINRVLRDRSVKAAIVQRHGTETYQMLKDWIQDIAAGPQGSVGRGFDFINYFRGNSTQAMLMFKVMTGVVNISGLFQSVNRIGARYVWEGFQRWTRSDKGILETVDWVREVSPFMAQRSENMHQVLFEMRDKLDGKHRPAVIAWQEAGWAIIAKTQTLVDMPTWLGAYQKALDGGAIDAEAVAQADQAVRDSQGSGELVDLARIQRSRNQFLRLYTSFMFYTNTTWNLGGNVVESWRNTDPNHRRAAAMLSQLTTLYFAQALFAEVIKMALRGTDEDEPEEIALDLVGSVFGEMLNIGTGGLAGVREVSSVFSSFAPQGPAGTRLIPAAHRFYQQAAQGELDAPLFRSALDMAGGLLPNVPSAQLTTTWRALERISEGEITGIRMLTSPIFGSPYRDR